MDDDLVLPFFDGNPDEPEGTCAECVRAGACEPCAGKVIQVERFGRCCDFTQADSGPSWDDVGAIERFLTSDERIILELTRSGKTPKQIAGILHLGGRVQGVKARDRAIRVARFFVRNQRAIESLGGLCEQLGDRDRRIVQMYVAERKDCGTISAAFGMSEQWSLKRMHRLRVSLRAGGNETLSRLLDDCAKTRVLRYRATGYGDKSGERRALRMEPWRDELVREVLELVGRSWYDWGGQDLKAGVLDCSGFAIEILKKVGRLPADFRDTGAHGLSRHFCERVPAEKAKPGDLVFYGSSWRKIGHVMVYVGDVTFEAVASVPDPNRTSDKKTLKARVAGLTNGRRYMSAAEGRLVGAGLFLRALRYRRDYRGIGRVP